jgi:hypothetical protein
MNGNSPQSWFDFSVMPTMDPRSIIQTASFEDNGGTMRAATFARSTNWLVGSPWANSPISPTAAGPTTTPNVTVPNTNDYDSTEQANTWNTLHEMVAPVPANLPLSVQKIMFLKAGTAFVNNIFLDWKAGVTSTVEIELSLRDNSVTSGDFTNGSQGTVPVFSFAAGGGITYGGVGRNFQVTLLRTGRFQVAMRVSDSAGNFSMYAMDWIVE